MTTRIQPAIATRASVASVLAVAAAAYGLRLLYCAHVELLPEEAYYWNYSRHLDLGYLDHPPMVAWLIRLGTTLFGTTEMGVRAGALACSIAVAVFVFRLTQNICGSRGAWFAVGLLQILPYFFLSGVLMTPDAPLTAAWAAALYYLERALVAHRRRAWIGVGLALGLGMMSKYTIALLAAAALLFMIVDPAARRWFRRWEPYAALLLAVAVFAPVIVWNAEHDWASFAFQTSRRLAEQPRFSLHLLVASVFVLLTPVGAIAAVLALASRRGERSPHRQLLTLGTLAPLAVFAVFSLRHEVKLDWTGAPWIAALPLIACVRGSTRWLAYAWPPTAATMVALYACGLVYLWMGLPGAGYSAHTELVPVGWRQLGRRIDAIAVSLAAHEPAPVLVVGMDRYHIASELAFYANDPLAAASYTASVNLFGALGLMYEPWFPAARQTGKTLLLVSFDPSSLDSIQVSSRAGSLDPLQSGELVRDGTVIRRYYYRVLHGFRYLP